MQRDAPSNRDTSTSEATNTSLALHPLHGTLEELVQNAERLFVLKDYDRALELSIEAMRRTDDENDHCLSSLSSSVDNFECIQLQANPSLGDDGNIPLGLVQLTLEVSLADRAAAIALQSGYEMSDDARETGHSAFMDFYRQRPMSLDVAILWIQYSFRVEKAPLMVEVTAELLHCVRQCSTVSSQSVDDLWALLYTEMMPFSTSPTYVQDVLDRIDTTGSWIMSSGGVTYARADEVDHEVVSILLSRLDKTSSFETSKQCRRTLANLVKSEKVRDEHGQQDQLIGYNSSLKEESQERVRRTKFGLFDNLALGHDWNRVLSRRLVDFIRTHIIVRPPPDDQDGANDAWTNRGPVVAISALLLYFVWKRRRKLLQWTMSATLLMTSPFREVLDALLPQSSQQN